MLRLPHNEDIFSYVHIFCLKMIKFYHLFHLLLVSEYVNLEFHDIERGSFCLPLLQVLSGIRMGNSRRNTRTLSFISR